MSQYIILSYKMAKNGHLNMIKRPIIGLLHFSRLLNYYIFLYGSEYYHNINTHSIVYNI